MANTNLPYWGIQPMSMTKARESAIVLPITNNYGTALYQLDPALAVTAGRIERGATSGAWLGVILGLYRQETPNSIRTERLLPVQYIAATPGATYEYFALVTIDPFLLFTMQEDALVTSLTQANMWGACDVTFGSGGSTTTGLSGCLIDSSSIDATATRPLQLIAPFANYFDVDKGAYNNVTAATTTALNYGKFIVRIFNHQMGSGSLAVAFT